MAAIVFIRIVHLHVDVLNAFFPEALSGSRGCSGFPGNAMTERRTSVHDSVGHGMPNDPTPKKPAPKEPAPDKEPAATQNTEAEDPVSPSGVEVDREFKANLDRMFTKIDDDLNENNDWAQRWRDSLRTS